MAARQVYFAGRRLQVAGWNLIITEKLLALKIINNLYTRQGFLHKVVRLFHIMETHCHKYWGLLWQSSNLLRRVQKPETSYASQHVCDRTWFERCSHVHQKHDRSAIGTYRSTSRDQWNLFKAIWMAAPQMFPSIPDLARVFPQQQKIAITNEANK